MTRPTPADRRRARAQARRHQSGRTMLGRTRRSRLARNYVQDENTGRMAGSDTTPQPLTTAHAVRYALRKCPWCRGTNWCPLYTGTGTTKTVRGYAPCTHLWSVPDGGPGQKGLGRGDRLDCNNCQSRGFNTITVTVTKPRMTVVRSDCCEVCGGWVVAWNTRRGPQRKRAMRKLRANLAGGARAV